MSIYVETTADCGQEVSWKEILRWLYNDTALFEAIRLDKWTQDRQLLARDREEYTMSWRP